MFNIMDTSVQVCPRCEQDLLDDDKETLCIKGTKYAVEVHKECKKSYLNQRLSMK